MKGIVISSRVYSAKPRGYLRITEGAVWHHRRVRAIVQRVSSASVVVEGKEIGSCGQGLLLLVGVHVDDVEADARKLAQKITHLRIFNDQEGKLNLSIKEATTGDHRPQILAVSNFTVYGETKKSRRPSFAESAPFERAGELFDIFVTALQGEGIRVETGEFGAHMDVSLLNDGPVTLILDVP